MDDPLPGDRAVALAQATAEAIRGLNHAARDAGGIGRPSEMRREVSSAESYWKPHDDERSQARRTAFIRRKIPPVLPLSSDARWRPLFLGC